MTDSTIFQLFDIESSTYTYLLVDLHSREAALIDPVLECLERDLKLIREMDLKLKYVLDTHVHADHITAAGEIRKQTGAKSGISETAGVECADLALSNNTELQLGSKILKVLSTPGHTKTCVSFFFEGAVFTGDALLIRGTGRTDFQQGSASVLYNSINEVLFKLPDSTVVYPAHDYNGHTRSTIGLEKRHNPRIGGNKTEAEFVKIMSEVKLSEPKKMKESIPANLLCGQKVPH